MYNLTSKEIKKKSVTNEEQKNYLKIQQEIVCDITHILSMHSKYRASRMSINTWKGGGKRVDKKNIASLSKQSASHTHSACHSVDKPRPLSQFLVGHAQLAVIHVLHVLYFPPLCPLDRSDISCWWLATGPHRVCGTGACREVSQKTKPKENQNLATKLYFSTLFGAFCEESHIILSYLLLFGGKKSVHSFESHPMIG